MFIDRANTPLRERVRFISRWLRRIGVVSIVRARGGTVEIIGCNIGPIESAWGRVFFSVFMRLATRITVRDTPSQELGIQLAGKQVVKAPDMVLSYMRRWSARRPDIYREGGPIGISVMMWPGLSAKDVKQEYLQLVREIRRQFPSAPILLFGFQDKVVRDDILVECLMRLIPDSEVRNCSYRGDLSIFLADFNSCSRFVSTRFHAGILALALGIPMVQLAYSDKITNSLDELQWCGSVWPTESGLLTTRATEIVGQLKSASQTPFLPPSASVHAAHPEIVKQAPPDPSS